MNKLLILIVAANLIGCSTSVIGVSPIHKAQAKPETCEVEVFTSEKEVTQPFEVTCLIDAKTGSSRWHDPTVAGAINIAKPKACECGADAIILVSAAFPETKAYSGATAIVKAIRFTRPR